MAQGQQGYRITNTPNDATHDTNTHHAFHPMFEAQKSTGNLNLTQSYALINNTQNPPYMDVATLTSPGYHSASELYSSLLLTNLYPYPDFAILAASSTAASPDLSTPSAFDHQSPSPAALPLFNPGSSSHDQAPLAPNDFFSQEPFFNIHQGVYQSNYIPDPSHNEPSTSRLQSSPSSAAPGSRDNSPDLEGGLKALKDHKFSSNESDCLADYRSLAFNPTLQRLYLDLQLNWKSMAPNDLAQDVMKFFEHHYPPAGAKRTGKGSRGGASSFTCLWPGCEEPTIARSDRAQEHMYKHMCIQRFRCDTCNQAFLRKNECNRHEKSCKRKGTTAAKSSARGSIKRSTTGLYLPSVAPQLRSKRTATMQSISPTSTDDANGPTPLSQHLIETPHTSPIVPSQQFSFSPSPPLYEMDNNTSIMVPGYGGEQPQAPFQTTGYIFDTGPVPSSAPAGQPTFSIPSVPTSIPMVPTSAPPHPSFSSMPPFVQYRMQGFATPLPTHPYPPSASDGSFMQEDIGHRFPR